jgi:hypothetical protein
MLGISLTTMTPIPIIITVMMTNPTLLEPSASSGGGTNLGGVGAV